MTNLKAISFTVKSQTEFIPHPSISGIGKKYTQSLEKSGWRLSKLSFAFFAKKSEKREETVVVAEKKRFCHQLLLRLGSNFLRVIAMLFVRFFSLDPLWSQVFSSLEKMDCIENKWKFNISDLIRK